MSGHIKRRPDGRAVPLARRPPADSEGQRSRVSGLAGPRLLIGLVIAMIADVVDISSPMLSVGSDLVAAVLLSVVFGARWETILVLVPEVLPVTSVFPTWVILVFYLAGIKRPSKRP